MSNAPEILDPARVAADLIGAPGASTPAPTVSDQTTQPAQPAEASPVTPTPDGMMDKAGRVFDAARYKSNPDGTPFRNKLGYFMPKGGRRPGGSAPAAPIAPTPASVSAPTVSAPPAALPASAAPAWSEAEKAAAASPVPEAAAPGSAPSPAAEAVQLVDYSNDAAKALSHGVFALGGFIFDAREEVRPPKVEAEHLTEATAAWIRSTGWRGGPLAGMLLAWTAYALGLAEKPKISAKFREWFGSGPKPQKAVDIVATPVPPAAPKATPVNPAAPVGFGGLRQG